MSPFDLKSVDMREEGDVDGDLEPSRRKRNADRNRMILWQDNIVPYKFDPGLPGESSITLFLPLVHKQRRRGSLVVGTEKLCSSCPSIS